NNRDINKKGSNLRQAEVHIPLQLFQKLKTLENVKMIYLRVCLKTLKL
ncbi:hypothetical protein M5D96_010772, partial [Drosophila gunungcola]